MGHGMGGGSSNGSAQGGNGSDGAVGNNEREVDASMDSGSAMGRIAQGKRDRQEREGSAKARHLAEAKKSGQHINNDAHGDAVSAAAKLAKSEHDGDTVGSDVRAVAHRKTSGRQYGMTGAMR